MTVGNNLFGMHAIKNNWSSQSPAHAGITNQTLFQLAADGGSNIIRAPLDLSVVGPSGPPQWGVDSIGTVLRQAASLGLKVILEQGQTPPDLLPAGTPLSQAPDTDAGLEVMGRRFRELVEAVHTQYGQYANTIAAWEVGNDGFSPVADGSFGLYERSSADGTISEKPIVALFEAIATGIVFASPEYRFISRVSTDSIDVSGWGTNGVELANGYIILTHDGNDTVIGSAYGDNLFACDGDDAVDGYLGDDPLDGQGGSYNQVDYGGAAADYLFTREADGSVRVSHDVYGTDTLRSMDGIWFYGEEQWYAFDALASANTQQASGFDTCSVPGSRFKADAGADRKSDGSQSEAAVAREGDMLVFLPDDQFGVTELARLDDMISKNDPDMGALWFEPEMMGGFV